MGPVRAVGSVLGNYFNFSGRASRSEFWWWALVQPLILCATVWVDVQSLRNMDPAVLNGISAPAPELVWVMITPWVSLFFFFPNLAVSIRRLHDIGRSGFWYLLILVPLIGPLILLVFWLLPSQGMNNHWGAPASGDAARDATPMEMPALAGLQSDTMRIPQEEISNFYRKRVLGEA